MSTHRILQVLTAGLVFGGAYLAIQFSGPRDGDGTPKVDTVETPKAASSAPVKERKGVVPQPKVAKPQPKEDKNNRLLLPDGSTVPVLNGAFGAPPMGWPDDRPWSPIVGKELDQGGEEWYVHEDGSRSTTQNRYHTHIGGFAPVTTVANPTKVMPMAPEELEAVKKEQERKKALEDAKKQASKKD